MSDPVQTTEIAHNVAPNKRAMLEHIAKLFTGTATDNLIEIAWSSRDLKSLNGAKLFPATLAGQMAAVELAEQRNREGRNVYFGANPRKPGTARDKRASDADVAEARVQFIDADGDNPKTAEMIEAEEMFGMGGSVAVVTGEKPTLRQHVYWVLSEPADDLAAWTARQKRLAAYYGSDPSVVNASRIMRLPGSVSYPKAGKAGREPELVYARSNTTSTFHADELDGMCGSAAAAAPTASTAPAPVVAHDLTELIEGVQREGSRHASALALLKAYRDKGWPAEAAVEVIRGYLLSSGGEPDGTAAKLESMARTVFNGVSSPAEDFEDIEGGQPERADSSAPAAPPKRMAPRMQQLPEDFDPAALPTRKFLLGRRFMRGAVTEGIGAPGVSKSTFSLLTAVAIASGRNLTNEEVHEQTNVCIYNAEDDEAEIKRRIAGICIKYGISYASIRPRLFFMSGTETPLYIAVKDKDIVRSTQAAGEVIADLVANDIGYLALDPLASLHNGVGENDNSDMNTVLQIVKTITKSANCATDLVHHTKKISTGNSEAGAGDMNMGRGAGAVGGAVRFVYTLSAMSDDTATELGIPLDEARRYVCLMDAKSNYQLKSAERTWFRLDSVFIGNGIPGDLTSSGDSVGVHEWRDLTALRRQAEEAQEARDAERLQAMAETIASVMPSDDCAIKDVLPAVMKAWNVKDVEARKRINSAVPVGDVVFATVACVTYTVWRERNGEHVNATIRLKRERCEATG